MPCACGQWVDKLALVSEESALQRWFDRHACVVKGKAPYVATQVDWVPSPAPELMLFAQTDRKSVQKSAAG
jgi:hypothetical protein